MHSKIKGALRSRTIWLNMAGALVGLIGVVQQYPQFLANYMSATTYNAVIFALAVLNVALRFVTEKGLEDK